MNQNPVMNSSIGTDNTGSRMKRDKDGFIELQRRNLPENNKPENDLSKTEKDPPKNRNHHKRKSNIGKLHYVVYDNDDICILDTSRKNSKILHTKHDLKKYKEKKKVKIKQLELRCGLKDRVEEPASIIECSNPLAWQRAMEQKEDAEKYIRKASLAIMAPDQGIPIESDWRFLVLAMLCPAEWRGGFMV